MNTQHKHLQDLQEIRSLMERSSRFMSLSGLSGVCAGVFALMGAAAAYYYVHYYYGEWNFYAFFFTDAIAVLILSLTSGIYFTVRQAKRKGQNIWDATSRRVLINLAIPLITGGIFIFSLLQQAPDLVSSATLIFYGLALINCSKFTLNDIRFLGFSELILGLLNAFFIHYSLLFWAIGFGVLHIVYGTAMY